MTDDSRGAGQPVAEEWPAFALARGTTVNGYRLEQVLGSGGFGVTYLASDLLGQQFAIKEYYPRQFASRRDQTVQPTTAEDAALFEDCKRRFLREAHALVRLGKVADAADGIVRVKTYFEAFGTGFLVMDYVAGESLAAVLRREPGGLPPARVRSLLTQLLASVRIVHQAGLVHRDIKPANIIQRDNERLVLIDFGATRLAAPGETTTYTQIYSGGYGPPEQMLGLRQAEFSDIYAIGAVCYRAIGGSLANALARQNSLAAGRPDPLAPAATVGAGRYPRSLLTAIDAALAVDPAQRPQNVDAMLRLLGPEEAQTAPAPAKPTSAKPRPWGTRRLALVGLFAVFVTGAVYLLVPRSAAPPSAPPPPPAVTHETLGTAEPEPAPQPPAVAAAPEEPRREAVVVPPPSAPPPPAISPLDQARSVAASLPCSALTLAESAGLIRVSGFAQTGQGLDQVLAQAQQAGRVTDAVSRLDRLACAPLEALAPLIRRNLDSGSPDLALRLEQASVAVGGRLAIGIVTSRDAVYLDLYLPDGSVRHLLRPAQSGTTVRKAVEWTATPPPGPRLFVAMAADGALASGSRADTERAGDYLEMLRARQADAPPGSLADLAMVMVRPAEPAATKPVAGRPSNARSERCANIISRAQLGETLSNAEVAALQNECRS